VAKLTEQIIFGVIDASAVVVTCEDGAPVEVPA
jgi:hypothetical protein